MILQYILILNNPAKYSDIEGNVQKFEQHLNHMT